MIPRRQYMDNYGASMGSLHGPECALTPLFERAPLISAHTAGLFRWPDARPWCR